MVGPVYGPDALGKLLYGGPMAAPREDWVDSRSLGEDTRCRAASYTPSPVARRLAAAAWSPVARPFARFLGFFGVAVAAASPCDVASSDAAMSPPSAAAVAAAAAAAVVAAVVVRAACCRRRCRRRRRHRRRRRLALRCRLERRRDIAAARCRCRRCRRRRRRLSVCDLARSLSRVRVTNTESSVAVALR